MVRAEPGLAVATGVRATIARVRRRNGMKRAILSIACATVIAALAGCGDSGSSNPAAKVKVGGLDPTIALKLGDGKITTEQVARVITQQRASAKASNQTVPKDGTKEFTAFRKQIVEQMFLQRVYATESKKCGKSCEVTEKDVDARIADIIKSQLGGDKKKFDKLLADRSYTQPEARDLLRGEAELPKLYAHITKDVTFTEADAKKYYADNKAQYQVRAGRRVYHILVKTEALAAKLSAQATEANFASLAQKFSQDPGSKSQGGDLGLIQKGAFVPEFEAAAFKLKDGEISKPVKSQFGWHVIRVALQPATTTPFDEAKAQIISAQSGTKKQEAFKTWQEKTVAAYRKSSTYASLDLVPDDQLKTTSTSTAPASTVTTGTAAPATP